MKESMREAVRTWGALLVALLALMSAASAQAPAPMLQPPVTVASDYRIGSGDLLRIAVFDHPELSTDVRVSQSGNLTYPLVGQLAVGGLSPHELEKALARGLADGGFVHQPQVSVLVVDYQNGKFAVLGQVTKPGQYPLTTSKKVIDALADAGGVVNLIGADDAMLLKHDGRRMPIDLISLFQGDARQNLDVTAGDTLYVPRAPLFYIYGAVQRPGAYRLERGMTVYQAISAGGGLTPKGSDRRVIAKRVEYAGGKQKEVALEGPDLVQADDVLKVKESLF